MLSLLKILAGMNPGVVNWLMFVATLLGIIVACSGIFGWPVLPLIRRRGGNKAGGVVPNFGDGSGNDGARRGGPWAGIFGGGGDGGGHTTVNNFYWCTFSRDPDGTSNERDGPSEEGGGVMGREFMAMIKTRGPVGEGESEDDGRGMGYLRVKVDGQLGEVIQ